MVYDQKYGERMDDKESVHYNTLVAYLDTHYGSPFETARQVAPWHSTWPVVTGLLRLVGRRAAVHKALVASFLQTVSGRKVTPWWHVIYFIEKMRALTLDLLNNLKTVHLLITSSPNFQGSSEAGSYLIPTLCTNM